MMLISVWTDFDVGEDGKEDIARIELVGREDKSVELRVRYEHVCNLDRDQLLHIGEMIKKIAVHIADGE